MKIRSLAVIVSMSILLLAGFACGGGQGAAPTPTATAEPTATIEMTVEATPTIVLSNCPPPKEGKCNIAGVITWNGQPWMDEFGTRASLRLYLNTSDFKAKISPRGVWILTGDSTATTTSNLDGTFCFRNVDPGEYLITRNCPSGSRFDIIPFGPITVAEGETYWIAVDPYDRCTY